MRVLLCCTCVLLVTTPVKAFAPLGSPCTGLHTCHPDPVCAGRHDLVTHRRLRDSYSSCHDLRMYECMHACQPKASLERLTPEPHSPATPLLGFRANHGLEELKGTRQVATLDAGIQQAVVDLGFSRLPEGLGVYALGSQYGSGAHHYI